MSFDILDNDSNLIPVLECMASLCAAIGIDLQQFLLQIYQRCLKIIEKTLLESAMAIETGSDMPDKEIMACCLGLIRKQKKPFLVTIFFFFQQSADLLSAICDGIKSSVESLIVNSNILQLLFECIKVHISKKFHISFFFFFS